MNSSTAPLLLSVLACTSHSVAGTVSTWLEPAGGSFGDAANWSPGTPGPNDTALFELDAAFSVEVDEAASISRLIVRAGEVSFFVTTVSAFTLTNFNPLTPALVVGEQAGDAPVVVVSQGLLSSTFAAVGLEPGSAGSLHVAPGALFLAQDVAAVGNQGSGTLTIENSTAIVQQLRLGVLDGAEGEAFLDGGDLACDGTLVVGQKGVGQLAAQFGATVSAGNLVVAQQPFSLGAIELDHGAQLLVSTTADIGRDAIGGLSVRGGASVQVAGLMTVGTLPEPFFRPPLPGGDGSVTVEGVGSLLAVLDDLFVPFLGKASLLLADGGRVQVLGDLSLGLPDHTDITIELSPQMNLPAIEVAGSAISTSVHDVQIALPARLAPQAGDQFPLLAAASFDGPAPKLSLPALPPGLVWVDETIELFPGFLRRLRVRAAADLNDDGAVNGADMGILLSNWGASGPGDLNGDGLVDGADLGLLVSAWT